MELSKKSIQQAIQRLQKIENKIVGNVELATKDLMKATLQMLEDIFVENNLGNHIDSLKSELIENGTGFRIWCNDWIVIFNEYGTGVRGEGTHPNPNGYKYNQHKRTETEEKLHIPENYWLYYKDGNFYITNGMEAKRMFYDTEQALKEVAKEFYNVAINRAINDEQYQSFKTSLRR